MVYKWTDADGVVHYSDQAVPGAEKIVTSSGTLNSMAAPRASAPSAPNKATPSHLRYNLFSIESPAKEQVFYGDEVVPVRLGLDPDLKPKQEISWTLNGSPLTEQGPNAVTFALPTLARGTYVITATVTDSITGESQSADSVTFYVRQPSELDPLHRR